MSNDQIEDHDKADCKQMHYHGQDSYDTDKFINPTSTTVESSEPTQLETTLVEKTLRVLTLNCWGLWWVAKLRPERIRGIVRFIRDNDCDIVFLQEVWVHSDYEFIRDNTSDIYRFAHHYKSGSLLKTSGIVILSKWLPKLIHFEPYVLNGSPFYFWHGDWFAGKGVAYARVDLENSVSLHLFSTHTHAYYKENERVLDQYSVHRVCQSYQLARFINFISDTTFNRHGDTLDLIVVAGDFNCTSSEMPYKIVTTMANLTDCLKLSKSNSNNSNNIIHTYKIRPNGAQKNNINAETSSIDSSCLSGSIPETAGLFSPQKQKGDSFMLEDYKKKIAHILFDSDTEDEDSTYCNPKNSFTGCRFKKASTTQPELVPATSEDSESCSKSRLSHSIVTKRYEAQQCPRSCSADADKCSGLSSDSSKRSLKKYKRSNMKRIDFILCRLLGSGRCIIDRATIKGKDPQLSCSLSDHEPVMVELKISHHDELWRSKAKIADSPNSSTSASSDNSPVHRDTNDDTISESLPQLEETTQRMTPINHFSINEKYNEASLIIMEQFQDILRQYYRYNGRYKFRVLLSVLLLFITIMPLVSYYGICNDLLPRSTIVLIWLFGLLVISGGCLAGFMSYRIEQGAIEATLNDIACRINVARMKQAR